MVIDANDDNTLPLIDFNESQGTILIRGKSTFVCPEMFYESFTEYLKRYLSKHAKDLEVTVDLAYFNTRSARPLLLFFKTCQSVVEKGFKLKINWIVEVNDLSMEDAALDFSSILKIPFNIIEKLE